MKKKKSNQELIDNCDYLSGAASATDFTGLIPSLPENEAELEAYNELYPFRPPVSKTSKQEG